MKLKNYLLQIEKSRNKKNKEDICLHGVSSIIKLIYLDIKKRYKRKTIEGIFKELKIPYQTLYSWISGSNPIPISKAYYLLNFWKKVCKKS